MDKQSKVEGDLIAQLNTVSETDTVEQKKIYELEVETPYKITFAKIINTKYGNSVLLHLNESISTFLPKRYSAVVKEKQIDQLIGITLSITSIEDKMVTLNFIKNKKKKTN